MLKPRNVFIAAMIPEIPTEPASAGASRAGCRDPHRAFALAGGDRSLSRTDSRAICSGRGREILNGPFPIGLTYGLEFSVGSPAGARQRAWCMLESSEPWRWPPATLRREEPAAVFPKRPCTVCSSRPGEKTVALTPDQLPTAPVPRASGEAIDVRGRFRIEAALAQGGMGMIYRAWEREAEPGGGSQGARQRMWETAR